MKLVISDRDNANKFATIFHHMNTLTDMVQLIFSDKGLYLQAMDVAHVCLFELSIESTWFNAFKIDKEDQKTIAINISMFYKIINTKQENQAIELNYTGEPDKLLINFTSDIKGEHNKYFELPLVELDYQLLNVNNTECQAAFVIESKVFSTISDQLMIFDESINVYCDEEKIKLVADGLEGKMEVPIPIDQLEEYEIEENGRVNTWYSLKYFHKMASFHKIAEEVKLEFSGDFPMKMTYDLGGDSYLKFFLAPKIED